MKKMALLLVAVSLFVASPVMATDGKTLLQKCREYTRFLGDRYNPTIEFADIYKCLGLVEGTTNTHDILTINSGKQGMYCQPSTSQVELEKNTSIVLKYLKEHPEELHLSASYLILKALKETFPCSK